MTFFQSIQFPETRLTRSEPYEDEYEDEDEFYDAEEVFFFHFLSNVTESNIWFSTKVIRTKHPIALAKQRASRSDLKFFKLKRIFGKIFLHYLHY